jgi:hypothetical protein
LDQKENFIKEKEEVFTKRSRKYREKEKRIQFIIIFG